MSFGNCIHVFCGTNIANDFKNQHCLAKCVYIDVNLNVSLFTSLKTFVAGMSDDFDNLEKEAKELVVDIQQVCVHRYLSSVVRSTFSNVSIELRLFLKLPLTICKGKCSFPKISLIKIDVVRR